MHVTKGSEPSGGGSFSLLRSLWNLTTRHRFLGAIMLAVCLAALPGAALADSSETDEQTEMALTITAGGYCDGSDCYAVAGEDFTLAVELVEAPSAGYIAFETFIDYSGHAGLSYRPADGPADEILWPPAEVVVRGSLGPGLLDHGSISEFVPPLPVSNYTGLGVAVRMTCASTPQSGEIKLLPDGPVAGTFGSKYISLDPGVVLHTPKLDPVTLHCVGNLPDSNDARASAGPAVAGDANCDGAVNAIDAGLILQFSAGLTASLPCAENADANGDGELNALDAAVVLQIAD